MSNKWVVNASPLILLAKVGHIELLSNLTGEFVIPAARPICDDLVHAGLLIDPELIRDALRLVGE